MIPARKGLHLLAKSTIRTLHEITGEEHAPSSEWRMRLLSLQTLIDRDLWVRHVDVVLIGGDPLLIARRVKALLAAPQQQGPLRIGLLHPAEFSGAPLAALEDPGFRDELGLMRGPEGKGFAAARSVIHREIDAMCALLQERSAGGVLAFEMVQGLRDSVRNECVFRLTRDDGVTRKDGIHPSSGSARGLEPKARGEGRTLFERSKSLWDDGLRYMARGLQPILTSPPARQNYGDLVISGRCELLSGFVSPPGSSGGRCDPAWFPQLIEQAYEFAGAVPKTAGEALNMWRSDFGRAGKVPISSQDKEKDR